MALQVLWQEATISMLAVRAFLSSRLQNRRMPCIACCPWLSKLQSMTRPRYDALERSYR
jgi:hypothetical protein